MQSALKNKDSKSLDCAREDKCQSPDGRENPFVAAFDAKDWNDSGNKLREEKNAKSNTIYIVCVFVFLIFALPKNEYND
jgi:hypothetical protein